MLKEIHGHIVNELQQNLVEAARTWHDRLTTALYASYGEARGRELSKRYAFFPPSYQEEVLSGQAVADIANLEAL